MRGIKLTLVVSRLSPASRRVLARMVTNNHVRSDKINVPSKPSAQRLGVAGFDAFKPMGQ